MDSTLFYVFYVGLCFVYIIYKERYGYIRSEVSIHDKN